jgi:hypothetical protein
VTEILLHRVYIDEDLYLFYSLVVYPLMLLYSMTEKVIKQVGRFFLPLFVTIKRGVYEDNYILLELVCGWTCLLFAVMLCTKASLFPPLLNTSFRPFWIVGAATMGVLQLVSVASLSRSARTDVAAIVFSVIISAMGGLLTSNGLTILHYLFGPFIVVYFFSIFGMMREGHGE